MPENTYTDHERELKTRIENVYNATVKKPTPAELRVDTSQLNKERTLKLTMVAEEIGFRPTFKKGVVSENIWFTPIDE